MSRAVFATLAMLAFASGLCFAQKVFAANQQPTPKMISAQPSPTSHEDSAAELELLELANQRRREVGAQPLRMDASPSDAARAHARLIVDRQQLSRQFDGEPRLMPRLLETGLRLDHVGENVAYNASAEKAFEALMRSPPQPARSKLQFRGLRRLLEQRPPLCCSGFRPSIAGGLPNLFAIVIRQHFRQRTRGAPGSRSFFER